MELTLTMTTDDGQNKRPKEKFSIDGTALLRTTLKFKNGQFKHSLKSNTLHHDTRRWIAVPVYGCVIGCGTLAKRSRHLLRLLSIPFDSALDQISLTPTKNAESRVVSAHPTHTVSLADNRKLKKCVRATRIFSRLQSKTTILSLFAIIQTVK